MRDLRRLLKYLKPHWLKFAFATVAMLAVGILESAMGALIVPIFDQAFKLSAGNLERTPTLFNLQRLIPTSGVGAWQAIAGLLVVFTLGKGIAEYFSTYLMALIGQAAVLKLRQDLYEHLLRQSASFYERHRTNYLVSRLVTSAAAIETSVTHTLRDMLRESWTLVAFLASSIYYSWRLTLGSLLVAPVIAWLTANFGRRLRDLARESYEGNQQLTDTAQEALANQTIVKAYRGEAREQSRFRVIAEKTIKANLRAAKISGIAPPTIEMIGVAAIVVLLYFGQREIAEGRMTAAQFLAFIFFLISSYAPMRKLSRLQNSLEQALAAARHVWEVIDEHEEIVDRPGAIKLLPLRRAIELKQVSFSYANEERFALNDVTLRIPAGQMIALVGESGGGKSTLIKLLMRFHDPSAGAVLWDGADLRDAQLESLRRQVALVTQETVLFNENVRYNIAYSRPEATTAEIEAAARTAFAHNFIMDLPAGYNTIVGERGTHLSGGQRQRLAIARAVLANAPVLIFDEATSALDAESEHSIQQALERVTRDRTTVVIAHRLSTVRRANQIVVIERGRILETGTHLELLAHSGRYRTLYELQFAVEEEGETVSSAP